MKNEWKKTHGDSATMEGIRALFFSKLTGLIVDTYPFKLSDAYRKIVELLDRGNTSGAQEIISNQVEKFYFWNDISALVNRHSEHGERREVDKLFKVYPVFFIYQVMLRLVDKGYESGKISKTELEHFVFIARSHDDLEDCVNRIVAYREYEEKYELEKLLRQKSNMDSRIFKVLAYSIYISYSPEFISLNTSMIDKLQERIKQFNDLIDGNKLVLFDSDSPSTYRNMLYSTDNLLEYSLKR